MRSKRCAMPWNVPTHIELPGTPNNFSMRARISAAALFVKVTARMLWGEAPCVWITQAMRCVSTRVLPEPAPASTSTGPTGAETASRCASLSGAKMGDRSMGSRILGDIAAFCCGISSPGVRIQPPNRPGHV
jgi:hypothetical protein